MSSGSGRRATAAAPVAAAVGSSVCALALLATSGWLITRAAEHPPVLYLLVAVVAVRAFGLFRGVLRYLERLSGHRLALERQSVLRVEVWAGLVRRSWVGRRSGDLLARLVSDVAAVQDRVVRVRVPLAGAAVTGLLAVLMVGLVVPAAGLWLFGCTLVGGWLLPWLGTRVAAEAEASTARRRSELAVIGSATAAAADELLVFHAAELMLADLSALDRRLRRDEWRRAVGAAIAAGGQWLGTAAATVGSTVIGAAALAVGWIDGPWFAVLALVPLGLHDVLAGVPAAWQTRTRVAASLARVDDLLADGQPGAGGGPVGSAAVAGSVRLDGLAVGWADRPVISGLGLDVRPGERVAIVGPSGVGKSTLAATLLGLAAPIAGSAAVGGPVGYLAQDAHLFDTTIAENLRIGRRDATEAEIVEALGRVGLDLPPDRLVGDHGVQVSGGEARRIALARLLLRDDPVLIMDEPTDQLDAPTARSLLAVIDEVTRGRTVIMLGHDPALLTGSDQVVDLGRYAAPGRTVGGGRTDCPDGPVGQARALQPTLGAAGR